MYVHAMENKRINNFLLYFLLSLSRSWPSLAQTPDEVTTDPPATVDLPWYIWLVVALAFSVAVILTGASVIFIVYSWYRFCRRRPSVTARSNVNDIQLQEEVDAFQGIVHRPSDEWELPRKQIKLITQLGIGEFGPVYDAEVKLVANVTSRALVKIFQQGTSQDLVRFRDDIEELMSFDHPNVGKLLGLVSQSPYYIVLELTVNGDLKTFLLAAAAPPLSTPHDDESYKHAQSQVTTPQRVAMVTDAASGLAYLESLGYTHRDVAARNCMVTQHLGIKITDYKVGRHLFRSEYAVQADGSLMPLRWMAPESILQNVFTVQTSVWSLGVLLWEVMSQGSFPYADLSDSDMMSAVCYHQYRLPRPQDCPDKVYLLMERCWLADPKNRPRPTVVYKTLESSILTNRYKHMDNSVETQLLY